MMGWVRFFVFLICLSLGSALSGQKNQPWKVADIPSELIGPAPVVIRKSVDHFDVHSPGRATWRVFFAATILSREGKVASVLQIPYNGQSQAKFSSGAIYDADGATIERIKAHDLEDISAFSSFSVYEDNRRLVYIPAIANYPYTVVYEYEIDFDGLVHWPTWFPQTRAGFPVQEAEFTLEIPNADAGRYFPVHLKTPATQRQPNGRIEYRWNVADLPTTIRESHGPTAEELLPHIRTAPNQFEYGGYAGNMQDWNAFAQWELALHRDKDELPEGTRQHLRQLTDTCPDFRSKVRTLYQYLQEHTRYVSVQLGIGGYMPFSASFVDEKKYGDCKALSNYMMAMLNVIGIRSHQALVFAGTDVGDVRTDFPSQQFNHVILCVPNAADTIWLECTSQSTPFGYLGNFTSDRSVLLITEKGGKIAVTPRYGLEENHTRRMAHFALDASGNVVGKLKATYSGLAHESISHAMTSGKPEEDLVERYGFQGMQAESVALSVEEGPVPVGTESATFRLDRYASRTGKRLFLPAVPFAEQLPRIGGGAARTHDFILRPAQGYSDTVILQLPDGYVCEFLPEPVTLESVFGTYAVRIDSVPEGLRSIRTEVRRSGRFSPKSLKAYQDYRAAVMRGDGLKVVLVREE